LSERVSIEQTGWKRIRRAILLIAGAALYRPLILWAENAWDLANPEQVFFIPGVALVIGIVLLGTVTWMGFRVLPVGFTVAALLFVMFHFHTLSWVPGGIWTVIVLTLGAFAHRAASDQFLDRLATIALALAVIAPVLQVGIQHVTHRHSYPLANVAEGVPAEPSGTVEDVLVVVVDSYPMLAVAEQWFGHDPSLLVRNLLEAGFEIERISWSHNTFTGLAVPSIFQLEQVADASPKGTWGNRRTSYDIAGGDNFVANSLRNAGFRYTHIESGWEGGKCRQVDACLESTWLDEAAWNLLSPSVLGGLLTSKYGSMDVPNTLRAVEHLTDLKLFGDGHHDFVYAHLMLPHAPYVVDETCGVLPTTTRTSIGQQMRLRFQLSCVDSLLSDIALKVGETTAVMITGDHGTGMGGQVGARSADWSDADIAERLGTLLAYKLPNECDGPPTPTNVYTMRAIMDCAVDADLPSKPTDFLLGADEPVSVEADRLKSIGYLLEVGTLEGPD
jgi:hypothetical protein